MDAKLIFLMYRALQWAASPFIVLYFAFRVLKNPRYLRRFQERLGFLAPVFRQEAAGAVWLHAVSVGEVLSAIELLRRLKTQLPGVPLFVSTATLAGRELADEKLAGLAEGVFYAPLDYCFAIRRVLRTLRPSVVVVAETEIWPNLYRESRRAGCGLLVINGRISDRAQPRYRRLRGFFRRVLAEADLILAQSAVSRERYLALGASPERVIDGGNLKYDFQPRDAAIAPDVRSFLDSTHSGCIWIAASTMPPSGETDVDEDDVVIEAFRLLSTEHSDLLLILAPRKPERFDAVAAKLESTGVRFVRRSRLAGVERRTSLPAVLLLDSIGELAALFSLDSVVFMGGSLANRGGHNILEPAFFGGAIVVGPHMENFPAIAESFRQQAAFVEISSARELAPAVHGLLLDATAKTNLGQQARRLAETKRGATDRAVRAIVDLRSSSVPRRRPPFPVFQTLWLLSRLWRMGSAWNGARNRARGVRLSKPVISVGNLSMGGSGKTPFVLWLAERLHEAGHRIGILTRGYHRMVPEKQTVVDPGASVPVARTGDEAQILVRSGLAAVGIGADRAATGRALDERFNPDVLILDDGFQHGRLKRDLDVVLLDALDPWGGGDVFPLGRLREDPAALARADVLVITRAEPGAPYAGIERTLRRYNTRAPILRARVKPVLWVNCASGQYAAEDLPYTRVAAFCGLANPLAFWSTLAALGCRPVARWSLGDHHRYRPTDLRRLAVEARALGAEALLTTEKDVMNFCDDAVKLAAPLPLLWLKIGLEVEGGEQLLRMVEEVIAGSRFKRE